VNSTWKNFSLKPKPRYDIRRSKIMSEGATVKDYIANLPDDRKKVVSDVRKAINKHLPKGFHEGVAYNAIAWSVPHSAYPAGYHCDPAKPLMLICLSSTKGGISLHHMGLYGSTSLLEWFQGEWPKFSSKKLDMGKGCVRFKKPDDIPLELIGQLATKLTPQAWVEQYEKMLGSRLKG
jgi:hypothetical protein